MKTLLLKHREISSWLVTLLLFALIGLGCRDFYKSTHSFAQNGNAPLTLKILATSTSKSQDTAIKPISKPQTKKTQKTKLKSQAPQKPRSKEGAKPQEAQKLLEEKPQELSQEVSQKQEVGEAQELAKTQEVFDAQEALESVELIASVQGEHFELYKQVHNAILKNVFYPKRARYKRLSGIVVVEFVLERNGSITQERVVQSSGYALLDESALKALNQTQFPTTPKRYRFRVPLRYG